MDILEYIFSQKVVTEKGCWEWPGTRLTSGYGLVKYEGRQVTVHRLVASIVLKFDINNSFIHALHRCDNPPCFNPDHLFKGSQSDNNKDSAKKGRRKKKFCIHGHPLSVNNVIRVGARNDRVCKICYKNRHKEFSRRRRIGRYN